MSKIPEFTDVEVKIVHDTLQERYGKPVETQLADIELRIYSDDRELTECPAIYWEHDNCHFILAKAAKQKFFSQFFYGSREQFGTGKEFYDDVFDCLVTTLRVQADHELNKQGASDSK